MKRTVQSKNNNQNQIIQMLKSLTRRYSLWEIWQDFIIMSACAISNCFPHPARKKREEEYMRSADKYTPEELMIFSKCLREVVKALEKDPEQDFLGELFMSLDLGDSWKGQFFTPYTVCRMMAAITYDNVLEKKDKGQKWVSVNDPACGAGALLLAFANECHSKGVNDQTKVLYVAQDIDRLAGCMCYIQLSLMGCPGYVVIGNTILHPTTSIDGRGLIPVDQGNVWYTPMYFSDIWQWRVLCAKMNLLAQSETKEESPSTTTE